MKHETKCASCFEFACPLLSDHRTQKASTTSNTHARSVCLIFKPFGARTNSRQATSHFPSSLPASTSKLKIVHDVPLKTPVIPHIPPKRIPECRLISTLPWKADFCSLNEESTLENDHFSPVYRRLSGIIGFQISTPFCLR